MDRPAIVSRALYVLFFCSGASGLIYQVIWVREFGYVFGNTIHSAALVVAVFMCGLGVGSYLGGRWADRRQTRLLAAYAVLELAIGALALGVAFLLPQLGALSAALSSYSRDATGWYVLSTPSYLARYVIAVALLAPITTLMGATLTVLIRHVVGRDLSAAGWRIGTLYGVNTAGAALGCFLTDQLLVPAAGLRATQLLAALLNLVAAVGAWGLVSREARVDPASEPAAGVPSPAADRHARRAMGLAGLALALSGFAALGMEIVWFRHIASLLGGLRAVFSMLLTVILIGIWLGAVAGGRLDRRFGRPALWFALAQAAFVVATLAGLAAADVRTIVAEQRAAAPAFFAGSGPRRALLQVWLNFWPVVREVGVPALMMGLSFPLANAVVQRVEGVVGRRAGALYLANTLGAVAGSLTVGFVLLPVLGMQRSATVLALAAALAAWPLYQAERWLAGSPGRAYGATAGAALAAALVTVGLWVGLPADHLLMRTLRPLDSSTRLLTISEGLNEVVAVTEERDGSRALFTNGHPMSATNRLAQRYMRAFAHVPLLAMEHPDSVLVICFGVGNTANAASLHPSVRRLDVADLSREILDHAGYFARWNGGVLDRPGVSVYLNDGRQHLRMQPPATYDLITLEPPPIEQAGVGALYSREFYALARTRLKPGGYLSQWLPAYQVPAETTLSMVRAFVEVFPQAVLLSGVDAHLILMGVNGPRITIDPVSVAARLRAAPAVQADLSQVYLGNLTELIGTFVASGDALAAASRSSAPVTDDRPRQEYAVRSRLKDIRMPEAIFAVAGIAEWCPACFVGGRPSPWVPQLDLYLQTAGRRYREASYLEYRLPVGVGR